MRLKSQKGSGLISVIASSAVLGLLFMTAMRAMSMETRSAAMMDKSVMADSILVAAGNGVQKQDFDSLLEQCRTRGILGSSQFGSCTISGVLNGSLSSPTIPPASGDTEVRRQFNGDPEAMGPVCVEMVRCDLRGEGRLLEVALRSYWKPNMGDEKLQSKILHVRRTRW